MSSTANFALVNASGQIYLAGSYDAAIAEAKKQGKCRLYRLELVDVLNANKAGESKKEPQAEPKKRKAK